MTIREDRFAAAAVVLVTAVALAVTWPSAPGPVNDDWQMRWSALHFAETGEVRNLGYSAMGLAGWTVVGGLWAKVAGPRDEILRLLPMALHVLGSWFAYRAARCLGAAPRAAALLALTVALNPIALWLSTSFQTDTGWAVAWGGAIWAWTSALRTERGAALAAGAVAVTWAAWVRQPIVALPIAMLCVLCTVRGSGRVPARRPILAAVAVCFVLGTFAFEIWYRKVHGPTDAYLAKSRIDVQEMARAIPGGAFAAVAYAGFFGLPLLPWAWQALNGCTRIAFGAGAAGAVLAIVQAKTGFLPLIAKSMPYLPNVAYDFGVGPLTVTDVLREGGAPPVELPGLVQVAAGAAFAAAGAILVAAAVRRVARDRGDPRVVLLAVAAIVYAGAAILFSKEKGAPLFDRYLVPLLLPLALLLVPTGDVSPATPGRRAAGISALAALGLFAVLGTRDFHRFHAARWDLACDAAARAGTTRKVDGGFEFNCMHHYVDSTEGRFAAAPGWKGWLVGDPEWVVATRERAGYEVVRREPVFFALGAKSWDLLLLRRSAR